MCGRADLVAVGLGLLRPARRSHHCLSAKLTYIGISLGDQMTIDELGSIGELLAAIATLLTLIYLATQIRQNTLQLRSSSRNNVLQGMTDDSDRLFDSERYEFMRNAVQTEELSNEQIGRFRLLINSWLSHQEMLFFDVLEGTLPESFEGVLRYRLFTVFELRDDIKELWNADLRHFYTPEFQRFVDERLEAGLTTDYPKSVYRR